MTKCPACDKELSGDAVMCVGCGHPMVADETTAPAVGSTVGSIMQFARAALRTVTEVRSPINVFTFGMLLCSAMFAVSSALVIQYDKDAFKWALHVFVGIVILFGLIILYCPKSLYRPEDLARLKEGTALRDEPHKVVLLSLLGIAMYMAYQLFADGGVE